METSVSSKKKLSRNYFKRYWQLYILLAIPMLYFLVFKYIPMVYIQIAFKKYSTLRNTIVLNLLDLCIGFPIPIIFALILNELVFKRFKKAVQTIAYMPHFLSWVIIYGIAIQLFAPSTGLVYLAAIAGINSELYEAASVDGAGRFSKMWHITLPGIKPTIVILLIMAIGNILGSSFDRPFALQNNLVMNQAQVLSTYVYQYGIKGLQFSLTTAVGLFQSVVGVFFLLMANWLSRKLGERGIW